MGWKIRRVKISAYGDDMGGDRSIVVSGSSVTDTLSITDDSGACVAFTDGMAQDLFELLLENGVIKGIVSIPKDGA